jgi:hypothetical protein
LTHRSKSERGISRTVAIVTLAIAAILGGLLMVGRPVIRFVRESFMQRVASAHYEILWPQGTASLDAMSQFAQRRETLFTDLDKKLGGVGRNTKIRIVFEPRLTAQTGSEHGEASYAVDGATIRTHLTNAQSPQLSSTADAEALLYAAWGRPGNREIGGWTAVALAGEWHGAEIGMAAAEVEQRLGHEKLANLFAGPSGGISTEDESLLGAAWISEVGEFGGRDAVRELYAAKMSHPSAADITKVLGTSPLELERKWELWMDAYLAGTPSMQGNSGMHMDMPMGGAR